MKTTPVIRDDLCSFTWNPGEWPYVTRCGWAPEHSGDHVDRRGRSHAPVRGVDLPASEKYLTEALVQLLTVPDYRTSRLHRDKCRKLAIEWPALAATLGALVEAHGREVPSALRQAMKAIAKETGHG